MSNKHSGVPLACVLVADWMGIHHHPQLLLPTLTGCCIRDSRTASRGDGRDVAKFALAAGLRGTNQDVS